MSGTSEKRSALPPFRFTIVALGVLLTLFFIWLLAFLLSDIGNLPGPRLETFEAQHMPAEQRSEVKALRAQQAELKTQIERQREIQSTLQPSMEAAEAALKTMSELQELGSKSGVALNAADQRALRDMLSRYNAAQETFATANDSIAALSEERSQVERTLARTQKELAAFRKTAREEYDAARRAHQLKVAALKLAFIVPLLLLLAWWTWRQRGRRYQPIYWAASVATFWMVCRVMHTHFPSEYFKYIAILAAIGILVALLVRVIRTATSPRPATLQKRRRRAYQSHRCAVCDFPIMRGAFRQAVWTKGGPLPARAPAAASADASATEPGAYACPACGAALFAPCESCGEVTHALLPFCSACGREAPQQ